MLALISLLFLATATAVPRSSERIIGGALATIEQYPFMSNMQVIYWGTAEHVCSGSLLTLTSVLSAAHCYIGSTPPIWRVRLGTTISSDVGQQHLVSAIVLHHNYVHATLDNDIAIVKLLFPAALSNSVGVARIAGPNYILPDNTVVYAVGWGRRSTDGLGHPEQLRHVDQNIINQEICAERYAYLKTYPQYRDYPDVTPGMICTGILDVGGKAPCSGDSGGPILHQGDIVIGVISWAYRCAEPKFPSVNARVSVFSNWIVANA